MIRGWFLFCVLLTGCASARLGSSFAQATPDGVMFKSMTQVRTFDGIDRQEAILLAQSELVFRGRQNDFRFDRPKVLREDSDRWIIRFQPLAKAPAESKPNPLMQISVDKSNGEVRSREVWPQM